MKKPVTRCLAVVALLCLGMTTQAQAGFRHSRLAAAKSCDCAPTCQPDCCRPTIVKPCCPNVYTYQRQRSCLKPPCCDLGCGPRRNCRPRHGHGCDTGCCEVAAGGAACCPGGIGTGACCETGAAACCPSGIGGGACCPSGAGCDNCDGCYLSPEECCRLAHLIYDSQTACYPRQRRAAVRKISNKYDCECTPEVMAALIYALNDCDPYVRETAAREINDQLRKGCCCSPELTQALTCALGDCHKKVVRNAEKALERCGYDVVEPCCETECCETGCCDTDACDGCGHGLRGRLRGLLHRHGGCGDTCCDDSLCCDADACCDGIGHGCGMGCRLRGLFKKRCGMDCCDNVGCCGDECCDGVGCGHGRCRLLGGLFQKHHGNDCCDAGCCDTNCCDGGLCGHGLCGHKGIGCKLKGIFARHHGSDCCDACGSDACDGCCAKKGCGLRGLFKRHHGDVCCDGCCPTSCCTTGAQPYAPAPQTAPQAAPAEADAPAPAPEVAPATPGEPQACRPASRTTLVGHFGLAN